ncbi:cold shock domain-containing protein [Kitasatospora cystarginea]|uniref:Cold shock domain-containing protein n=1 Tax=Kitasatospora cystarginea TaxID=58350 RepID=A0ABN3DDW8_9ACTN
MWFVLVSGRVLRFDDVRGYGFIASDLGGEDVFMHANDLTEEKYLFRSGVRVEFELQDGDRGPVASQVRLLDSAGSDGSAARPAPQRRLLRSGDLANGGVSADASCGASDALPTADFRQQLTELLLKEVPTLTSAQILQIREAVVASAQSRGWVAA